MKDNKRDIPIAYKIYILLILLSTILYGLGILVITPDTDPFYLKYGGIIGILIVELGFLSYYAKKKADEPFDERLYANLMKASSLTFLVSLIVLLSITFFLFFGVFTSITLGFLVLIIAFLVLTFAIIFITLENR